MGQIGEFSKGVELGKGEYVSNLASLSSFNLTSLDLIWMVSNIEWCLSLINFQDNMIDEEKAKAEEEAQEDLQQKLTRLDGGLGSIR